MPGIRCFAPAVFVSLLLACGGGGGDGPLAGACANGFAPAAVQFSSSCTVCDNPQDTQAANDGRFNTAASFRTGTSAGSTVDSGGTSNLVYTVTRGDQGDFAAGTQYGAVIENLSAGNPQVTLSFATFRNGGAVDSSTALAPANAEAITFTATAPYDQLRLTVSTQAPDASSEFFLFEFCAG